MELTGKVALVTGAARGIGRCYCEALVENGVKVAICDINVREGKNLECTLNREGKNSIFLQCDVTNELQFEDCFKRTIEEFGHLDIVVNNAGIIDDRIDSWRKEIDVNLCGVIQGSLLGLKYLKEGSVIAVTTSLAGVHRDSLYPIYAATKGGANYFVRSLGSPTCFENTGIRVLAIAPGLTDTPIIKQLHDNTSLLKQCYGLSKERIKTLYMQKPESVAACLIHVLKGAPSGSIWLVQNDKWHSINYSKLMND